MADGTMTGKPTWAVAAMTAVAAAMREDWSADEVTGALLAARANPDWPPGRAMIALAQAIADPEGSPRDLLNAARHPLERAGRPVNPQARNAAVADARAAISAARRETAA